MIRRLVCSFTYDGPAVGKGRPRATTVQGRARMYTPAKTVTFETAIGLHGAQAIRAQGPLCVDMPVALRVDVIRAPLKSWSRKKAEAMRGRCVTGKPDADNIGKAIADALNGVAYLDDAQIADFHVTRRWGDADEIIITVEAFDEEAA